MLETITTATITVASIFLFAYWFRYSCLLILTAKSAQDHTAAVIVEHQLAFAHVQCTLQTHTTELSQHLQDALDRDYKVLQRLLESAGNTTVEARMVRVHYRIMRAWCRVSTPFAPTAARRALDEMVQVIAHLANTVGECAATANAA